jgi:hypothetical protein
VKYESASNSSSSDDETALARVKQAFRERLPQLVRSLNPRLQDNLDEELRKRLEEDPLGEPFDDDPAIPTTTPTESVGALKLELEYEAQPEPSPAPSTFSARLFRTVEHLCQRLLIREEELSVSSDIYANRTHVLDGHVSCRDGGRDASCSCS